VTWTASSHRGTIALPDGSETPTGVTSFASGEKEPRYFVMSTPSVWQAARAGKGPELATMMVAVLLREGSHMAQTGAFFIEAEDIWLPFEGAGQRTAYEWMIHPRGAAQPPEEALARFQKGLWSQTARASPSSRRSTESPARAGIELGPREGMCFTRSHDRSMQPMGEQFSTRRALWAAGSAKIEDPGSSGAS
jgi:hypothetical protein